jgi:hypothetical protein
MSRYNFHDQLAAIRCNPAYKLPENINAPVIAFLEKIGCVIGIKILKRYQEHVNYGTIELFDKKAPNAKLSIQVDAGMAEGYNQFEKNEEGDWTAISYKSIKNDNLTKKKSLTKDVK